MQLWVGPAERSLGADAFHDFRRDVARVLGVTAPGERPPGIVERIVRFFRASDVSVAEAILAAVSAAIVHWLVATSLADLSRMPSYHALTEGFPDAVWLGYALLTCSLSVATFALHYRAPLTATALRVVASLAHVSFYTMLAWQITEAGGQAILIGQVFWVLAGAAAWSVWRACAKVRV